jgi:hypothetical protein
MILEQMKPGVKIKYHGGWDGTKERCTGCNFQCGYILAGVIIERYRVWDPRSESFIPYPEEHWVALLETGSYVSGDLEQFEFVANDLT